MRFAAGRDDGCFRTGRPRMDLIEWLEVVEEAEGGSSGVWINGDNIAADKGERAPVNIYMVLLPDSWPAPVFNRSSCGARLVLGIR